MSQEREPLERYLAEVRDRVDREIDRVLPPVEGEDPGRLREAMRYAVLGGGKRLRPVIVVAAAEAVGGTRDGALPAAVAVELLHAYTLVHDDLPAMDDDELRRGRPTIHVVFGEGNAILVGDALLTCAFGTLATLGGQAAVEAIRVLARRTGVHELLAGQARDLAGTAAATRTLAAVERLHAEKTGALFAAAAEIGAIAGGAGAPERARLAEYGLALGVAFQHADDLDDGDHAWLATDARRRVRELTAQAQAAIEPLGERAWPLAALARRIAGTA